MKTAKFDGYASYDKVMAVSACNDTGKRCVYSDYGECVWCAFPSSDFGYSPFNHPEPVTAGIYTTDVWEEQVITQKEIIQMILEEPRVPAGGGRDCCVDAFSQS